MTGKIVFQFWIRVNRHGPFSSQLMFWNNRVTLSWQHAIVTTGRCWPEMLTTHTYEDKEMDANIVTVLHICPQANREFRDRVTSPYLEMTFPGKGTLEIWKNIVPREKFMSISVEDLLTMIQDASMAEQEWVEYLKTRHGWRYQIE